MRINIDIDHSSIEEIDKAIEFLQNLKGNNTQRQPVVGGIFDMPFIAGSDVKDSVSTQEVKLETKTPERKSSPIIGFNEIYSSLKDERKKKDAVDIRVETY